VSIVPNGILVDDKYQREIIFYALSIVAIRAAGIGLTKAAYGDHIEIGAGFGSTPWRKDRYGAGRDFD
jgi:hypothetical protein